MDTYRPSSLYLGALARILGADAFGKSRKRTSGAKLLARLAGPSAEACWRTATGERAADDALREIRDTYLPAALRVSAARQVADRVSLSPLPAEEAIYYLAIAELALDHALGIDGSTAVAGALRVCQGALMDCAGRERPRCPDCGEEIDPDVCWCGSAMSDSHDNHAPLPMGCECVRRAARDE